MAKTRQLISEIERKVKLAYDGCDRFNEVLNKWQELHEVGKDRERVNQDIRNEYKKLLKARDEIKKYIGKPELKDKKIGLVEVRKHIQVSAMEKYKVWERDMKRKQYSKASLNNPEQKDSNEIEKEKTREWMNQCIEQFTTERDKCECELYEGDNQQIREKFELYKFHETKLEQLLRALENDVIQPSDVNELRDNIEFLIESPDDMAIHECLQEEYQKLEEDYLQDFVQTGGINITGGLDIGSASNSEKGGDNENELQETKEESSLKTQGKKVMASGKKSTTSGAGSSGAAKNTKGTNRTVKRYVAKPAASESPVKSHTPSISASASGPHLQGTSSTSAIQNSTIKEPKPVQEKPETTTDFTLSNSHDPTSPSRGFYSGSKTHQRPKYKMVKNKQANDFTSREELETNSSSFSVSHSPAILESPPPSLQNSQQKCPPTQPITQISEEESEEEQKVPLQSWTEQSEDDFSNRNSLREASMSLNQTQPSGASQKLERLNASWGFRPTEQQRVNYMPYFAVEVNTNAYPHMPLLNKPSDFRKLEQDQLFYAFYYQKGQLYQLLAAQELKRREWRFHKKYNTWFKKYPENNSESETDEKGTFLYFDFDDGWCQRKKASFHFESIYKETEDLRLPN